MGSEQPVQISILEKAIYKAWHAAVGMWGIIDLCVCVCARICEGAKRWKTPGQA